jgi:hypothetical protein
VQFDVDPEWTVPQFYANLGAVLSTDYNINSFILGNVITGARLDHRLTHTLEFMFGHQLQLMYYDIYYINADNMYQAQHMHEISFKLAYTTQTRVYRVNPQWTVYQLYERISDRITADFGVDSFILVKTMQNMQNGMSSEQGDFLNHELGYTLTELYGVNLHQLAFYVRETNALHAYPSQIAAHPIIFDHYISNSNWLPTDTSIHINHEFINGNSIIIDNELQSAQVRVLEVASTQVPDLEVASAPELSTAMQCCICTTTEVNAIIMPCHHVCACFACSTHASVTQCPICRTNITSVEMAFLA